MGCNQFAKKYKMGDIVGTGVYFHRKNEVSIGFYVNGNFQGIAYRLLYDKFYPAFSVPGYGTTIRVDFNAKKPINFLTDMISSTQQPTKVFPSIKKDPMSNFNKT
eukprot:TRINITY_DN6810_c0_g1_i2.p2 TRINITY_DN6810_c0_g1~~TRINITY_DN6810_c0_g1_i2.p2  ORF type:complete len:105 (-),score=22.67 TRINITY_DN6810_c0_g1_i2:21-335(-)